MDSPHCSSSAERNVEERNATHALVGPATDDRPRYALPEQGGAGRRGASDRHYNAVGGSWMAAEIAYRTESESLDAASQVRSFSSPPPSLHLPATMQYPTATSAALGDVNPLPSIQGERSKVSNVNSTQQIDVMDAQQKVVADLIDLVAEQGKQIHSLQGKLQELKTWKDAQERKEQGKQIHSLQGRLQELETWKDTEERKLKDALENATHNQDPGTIMKIVDTMVNDNDANGNGLIETDEGRKILRKIFGAGPGDSTTHLQLTVEQQHQLFARIFTAFRHTALKMSEATPVTGREFKSQVKRQIILMNNRMEVANRIESDSSVGMLVLFAVLPFKTWQQKVLKSLPLLILFVQVGKIWLIAVSTWSMYLQLLRNYDEDFNEADPLDWSTYLYSNGENWTLSNPFGGKGPGTNSLMCPRNHTALRQAYADKSDMTRSERNHLEHIDTMENSSKAMMFLVCIYLFAQRFLSALTVFEEEHTHALITAGEEHGAEIEQLLAKPREVKAKMLYDSGTSTMGAKRHEADFQKALQDAKMEFNTQTRWRDKGWVRRLFLLPDKRGILFEREIAQVSEDMTHIKKNESSLLRRCFCFVCEGAQVDDETNKDNGQQLWQTQTCLQELVTRTSSLSVTPPCQNPHAVVATSGDGNEAGEREGGRPAVPQAAHAAATAVPWQDEEDGIVEERAQEEGEQDLTGKEPMQPHQSLVSILPPIPNSNELGEKNEEELKELLRKRGLHRSRSGNRVFTEGDKRALIEMLKSAAAQEQRNLDPREFRIRRDSWAYPLAIMDRFLDLKLFILCSFMNIFFVFFTGNSQEILNWEAFEWVSSLVL